MTANSPAPPRADPADPVAPLAVVVALCWAVTLGLALGGDHGAGHGGPAPGSPTALAGAAAAWLVMIGAMMLPTIAPLVRMFAGVSARAPRPGRARAGLYLGYVAVWAAFVPVALLGAAGVHALVGRWDPIATRPGLVLGAALVLAGAHQFSPLKDACLAACRNPAAFLWHGYRRGFGGGWSIGTRHGLSCLGCCWALMLVMFVTGVAGLLWMLLLTGVMVIEKTGRRGVRLVVPVGIALLAGGVGVMAVALVGPS